jgi:hypothetical protein
VKTRALGQHSMDDCVEKPSLLDGQVQYLFSALVRLYRMLRIPSEIIRLEGKVWILGNTNSYFGLQAVVYNDKEHVLICRGNPVLLLSGLLH